MHSKMIYYWDTDDPIELGKRLDQAFNRILSFCPELLVPPGDKDARTPESISLNRVVGGEFDMSDVTRLNAYAQQEYGTEQPLDLGCRFFDFVSSYVPTGCQTPALVCISANVLYSPSVCRLHHA